MFSNVDVHDISETENISTEEDAGKSLKVQFNIIIHEEVSM